MPQLIDIAMLSDRHFWREGYDKAEMALRVEKAFGVDMETLLRMQAWYDTHAMRNRAGEIKVKRYSAPEPC